MRENKINREDVEYQLIPLEGNKWYYVSRCGKLWSMKYDTAITDVIQCAEGVPKYYKNTLVINGRKSGYPRHRLVAITFIPNPLSLPQVDHIYHNGFNNCVDNLRWVDMVTNNRNSPMHRNNTSGVTGVNFNRSKNSWRARWCDLETGKRRCKTFSINKYGEEEAFRLACECRDVMIREMNKKGAGYSENHGK